MLNKPFLKQEQEFSLLLYSEPQFLLRGLREDLLPYTEKGAQSVLV